ncbi:MAG: hypothetical protein CMH81_05495 [Nitrospiraceae bacterium]|nr:hypothetical protein [Nitrospiraceae bacterium]|tara:strand:- start:1020 stop:1325 length:306 start_codon:yes stop_codon:yes gene_type:complete
MPQSRLVIVASLCFVYLVLAGFVPAIGIHHTFDTETDGTHHHAIDTCTWLEHSIGSTLLSGADIDLNILTPQPRKPHNPNTLYLSIQLDSIKARAPPALLS